MATFCHLHIYSFCCTGCALFYRYARFLDKIFIYSKNSLAIKKGEGLFKMASVNKVVKSKGTAKIWLWWYRLMAKTLVSTAIQVNLCCLIPASLKISTKFTGIVVIKIFSISLCHHCHLLAAPLDFKTLFTQAILNRATPFLQPGWFWVDITSFCNLTCMFLQSIIDSSWCH